jgi:2-keto-4-pentenoate hydratase/2-oxohepta-3-ene-1,7-dioic acid hydratase in catechol pathway
MRLAIFQRPGAEPQLGLSTAEGVVAVDLPGAASAGAALKHVIAHFDAVRPELEALPARSAALPLDQVRLLPPLASPAKVLCSLRVTLKPEDAEETEQLHVFLKAPGSAIGDSGAVVLPRLVGADVYTHNLCLAVVIGRRSRAVPAADWREPVFGYTAMVDITGRTASLSRWKDGKSALGSSCDTFGPLGPWIVPRAAFEAGDDIALELRCNGDLRQRARVDALDDQIGRVIELASTVMTLHPGDVIAIEATAEGQAPVQDGDELQVDLGRLGRLTTTVRDPSGRRWDPAIRVHHDADSFDGQLPIAGHR